MQMSVNVSNFWILIDKPYNLFQREEITLRLQSFKNGSYEFDIFWIVNGKTVIRAVYPRRSLGSQYFVAFRVIKEVWYYVLQIKLLSGSAVDILKHTMTNQLCSAAVRPSASIACINEIPFFPLLRLDKEVTAIRIDKGIIAAHADDIFKPERLSQKDITLHHVVQWPSKT